MDRVMNKGHTYVYVRFSLNIRILFIAVVLAVCGDSGPVEAGVWDAIKEWYASFQLGELNEGSIPETPVEYAGKIGLEFKGKFELAFDEDTPGIGMVRWIGITSEGSLLITDDVARQAHEFSLDDGRYIRAFGRKGSGPGEYMSADNMAVDPQGRVYLLDLSQILRYDRQGRFLDKTRFIQGRQVLTGRNGELFFLRTNPWKIMELQRRDPATWAVLDRTPLSTAKHSFISYRMGSFVKLCYSATLHHLYYLGSNDYLVKEINAETGEVIRQFGQRPEGFVPLPKRYHGLGRGSLKDMRELRMSEVLNMTLIQDRYLMVSHDNPQPTGPYPTKWVIYDLDASARIKAYDFNTAAVERLESFINIVPWNSIAAWRNQLYIWRAPSEEAAETSNGTVEIYALSFATN